MDSQTQKGISQKNINPTQKGYVAPTLREYGSLNTLTDAFKPTKKQPKS
jgi:hypothetical protein